MSDDADLFPPHLIIRAGKTWQWLCIVVLAGTCCGITGLYTGSYITGQKMTVAMDKQRLEFENSTKAQDATHEREFEGVNKNTALIGQSVAALATAVNTLSDKINVVSARVGAVAATADMHSTQIKQIHATAKVALDKSVVAEKKTDAVEAKVDATASEVQAELPKHPPAPVAAPVPAKSEPTHWPWWGGKPAH